MCMLNAFREMGTFAFPPEVRMLIYEFLTPSNIYIDVNLGEDWEADPPSLVNIESCLDGADSTLASYGLTLDRGCWPLWSCRGRSVPAILPLMKTCKVVHSELGPLLCQNITLSTWNLHAAFIFAAKHSTLARNINIVNVHYNYWSFAGFREKNSHRLLVALVDFFPCLEMFLLYGMERRFDAQEHGSV